MRISVRCELYLAAFLYRYDSKYAKKNILSDHYFTSCLVSGAISIHHPSQYIASSGNCIAVKNRSIQKQLFLNKVNRATVVGLK